MSIVDENGDRLSKTQVAHLFLRASDSGVCTKAEAKGALMRLFPDLFAPRNTSSS